MKKLVVVLFVLCSVLFITNPILKSSFANNESKLNNKVTSSNDDNLDKTKPTKTLETNDETNLISTNEKSNIEDIKVKENNTSNDISSKDTSNNNLEETKDTTNNLDNTNEQSFDSKESNSNEQINVPKEDNSNEYVTKAEETVSNEQISASQPLTMDEALKLLMDMNPNLVYEYKGDENKFTVLKNKGLSGYVFLPKIDTDLGYFVDKNTSSIYYFHPSGYLEKIK
ncbi:hypothetical protein ACQQ2T_05440 [Paraclostridium tenue]